MGPVELRAIEAADLDEVLELNEANVPAVGRITRDRLAALMDLATFAPLVRGHAGALLGFAIVLPEDADYDSPNFAWFREHRRDHVYLDRIAVAEAARGRGVGRLLHDATLAHAERCGVGEVTLEINVEPPNPVSLGAHRALGFVQIGELWHSSEYGVAMFARPVGRPGPDGLAAT